MFAVQVVAPEGWIKVMKIDSTKYLIKLCIFNWRWLKFKDEISKSLEDFKAFYGKILLKLLKAQESFSLIFKSTQDNFSSKSLQEPQKKKLLNSN